MRDLLEQRLATRLREIADTVPDDVAVPLDLQLRVHREQRSTRRVRRWPAAAAAAVLVAVAGSLVVARGTSGHDSVRVGASPSTAAPVHDALDSGTVLLGAYGHFVVSLDARGRRSETMVSGHGEISYARATDSHHALWYLSRRGGSGCADVVRADIDGHSSTVVARAVTFDVSRDGSRLALYGAGDLAHDECSPVHAVGTGRVVVVDLATRESSAVALDGVTSLRWSVDGSSVVAVRCGSGGCSAARLDVPAVPGAALALTGDAGLTAPAGVTESVEFGFDGVYVLRSSSDAASGRPVGTIDRYVADGAAAPLRLFDGSGRWRLQQVVPTATGTYVVAAPGNRPGEGGDSGSGLGLYRLVDGRLVLVRPMSGPVALTAVNPLPAG
jgi:hypothetical protein